MATNQVPVEEEEEPNQVLVEEVMADGEGGSEADRPGSSHD